ncbi:hypothetical protein ACFXK0_03520 [Nocardia sp. NPDC059177]|uniref:hypothetical protein n=1 Tax=Nocardia sp. NPDC059177 TaxID=3346759 RepID=UPI0036B5562C
MNEIGYDFGTGIDDHWAGQTDLVLADTASADTLWQGFDGGSAEWECEPLPLPECDIPVDTLAAAVELFPDIPVGVDHRSVLAQEPAEPVSRPPWLAGS